MLNGYAFVFIFWLLLSTKCNEIFSGISWKRRQKDKTWNWQKGNATKDHFSGRRTKNTKRRSSSHTYFKWVYFKYLVFFSIITILSRFSAVREHTVIIQRFIDGSPTNRSTVGQYTGTPRPSPGSKVSTTPLMSTPVSL